MSESTSTVDVRQLRAAARSVLTHLRQLSDAGLEGRLKGTVVGHAIDLALGIDGHSVTDVGAPYQAEQLRAALALVDGPVAASLIEGLDDAVQ